MLWFETPYHMRVSIATRRLNNNNKLIIMDEDINEITEILNKYNEEETQLDRLLDRAEQTSLEFQTNDSIRTGENIEFTLEGAMKRNQEFLEEVKLIQGKLRSRAIFSPTEIQWDTICQRYLETPSLRVTTWRCHLPIYV